MCTQTTFIFISITICLGFGGKLVEALADRYIWLEGLMCQRYSMYKAASLTFICSKE